MTYPRPDPATHADHVQHARATFRAWLAPGTLALDTETTGLTGLAWEVAATDVHTGRPHLHALVQPPQHAPWSPAAVGLHYHRLAELSRAPHADPTIARALHGHVIVAYNAEFDSAALARTFNLTLSVQCAMRAYAPLAGQWSHTRGTWKAVTLTHACQREGLTIPGGLHRATTDADLLRHLIHAVAQAH